MAHGVATLAKYHPGGVVFVANAIGGANPKEYRPDNWYPTRARWEAGFVDYAGGEHRIKSDVPWVGQGADVSKLPV